MVAHAAAAVLAVLLFVPHGSATEESQRVIFSWARDVNTCDKDGDRNILDKGATRVVYAYNDDPVDWTPQDGTEAPIRRHTERGTSSVNFMGMSPEPPTDPDLETFTTTLNNVHVADRQGKPVDTMYYCKTFEAPKVDTKRHIIKFAMDIQNGNKPYVHHMLVYWCENDLPPEYVGWEQPCFDPDRLMPAPIFECYSKQLLLVGWAIGGADNHPPEVAGFPFGPSGPKHLIIEMHYDNPNLDTVVDSSGMEYWYTDKLREHDAGVFKLGHSLFTLAIPPKEERFVAPGHCPAECLAGVGDDGITVFGTLSHAHLAGRHLQARHFRKGVELEPLSDEPYYDFNFQDFMYLHPSRQILPGDHFESFCAYNTMDRENVTYGGISTREEMCIIFASYYPMPDWPRFPGYTSCATFLDLGDHVLNSCDGSVKLVQKDPILQPWEPEDPCVNYTKPEPGSIGRLESFDPSHYDRSQILDPDEKVVLHWKVHANRTRMEFAVETETTGWMGFGLSPNGAMIGSDITIAFMDRDGAPFADDRFAEARRRPVVDEIQDLLYVRGGVFDGAVDASNALPHRAPHNSIPERELGCHNKQMPAGQSKLEHHPMYEELGLNRVRQLQKNGVLDQEQQDGAAAASKRELRLRQSSKHRAPHPQAMP